MECNKETQNGFSPEIDKTDEYISDEGAYSSLSSLSVHEGDFAHIKVLQQSTDIEKQQLQQIRRQITNLSHKEISNLKQDIISLEISKQCKERSIVQLKLKIKEQQELIQEQLQENRKIQLKSTGQANELLAIEKLVDWYRNQLQANQFHTNSTLTEILHLKSQISEKDNEISQLKNMLDDYKHQQSIQYLNVIPKPKPRASNSDDYYLEEISMNNNEIAALRCTIQEQNAILAESIKEKKEFAHQCAIFEQKCRDMDYRLHQYEINAQSSRETINEQAVALREKEQQILYLKNELCKLRVSLDAATKEKKTIRDTANVLQSGFQKFLSMHEELKEELREKNNLTTSLEQTIQDNFMRENWRKCAIEERKAKDCNNMQIIQSLECVCENLRQNLQTSEAEKANLASELKEIKKLYKELLKNQQKSETVSSPSTSCHCEMDFSRIRTGNELIVDLQEQVAKLTDSLHLKCSQMRYKQERSELHNRTLLRKIKTYILEKRTLERRNHRMFEYNNLMYLKLHRTHLYAENLENFVYKRNVRITNLIEGNEQLYNAIHEKNVQINDMDLKLNAVTDNSKSANLQVPAKTIISSNSQTNLTGALLSRILGDYMQQKVLINDFIIEKSFLQRLICDLKATLITVSPPNLGTYSFKQFIAPTSIPNIEEVELLLARKNSGKTSLGHSIALLKNEMAVFKAEFYRKTDV